MLTQLRSFLAVMEEGSLNRAAVRLRLSQSALSRQVQALEDEIGGRLFERTHSGVSPTDAGHALAASIRPVLAGYESAMAEARRLARGQRDQIRIGYLASAAQSFLNPALAALRRLHPEVKVKLLDLSPGEQIAALHRGEIDLGLIGQEGCLAARDFYMRKMAALPVVAVLPSDHRLAARKKLRLAELRGERFVASPEADMPGRDRWVAQLCREAGFRPKFAFTARSVAEMFSIVSAESTVALAPAYLRDTAAAGVAFVAVDDAAARWDFLIVWQRGRTSAALQALIDALTIAARSGCERKRVRKPRNRRSTAD
jgi:DNA-binding transcriptional LysR family regulator